MGLSGISPWSLLLILMIILVLFGPKHVGKIGQELAEAIKQLRAGLKTNDRDPSEDES